jgi:predicted transcriptional regulator
MNSNLNSSGFDDCSSRITLGITMKTVTLKIPDNLAAKIRRTINLRKESFSDLARRALAREIEEQEIDFARLAAPYRGMFNGAHDLSSREGYGNKHHR